MKIAGYVPCSLSDFPGRLAAVIFTQGCNWRCPWCHNKGLIPLESQSMRLTAKEVLERLEKRQGRLDGIVISGGEPTLQGSLPSFLKALRSLPFAVKLDTNGSRPAVLAELIQSKLIDFIAMDLKAAPDDYAKAIGVEPDPAGLLRSVRLIQESGLPHHFRTTQWPGLTPRDLEAIRRLCGASELKLQEHRPAQCPAT